MLRRVSRRDREHKKTPHRKNPSQLMNSHFVALYNIKPFYDEHAKCKLGQSVKMAGKGSGVKAECFVGFDTGCVLQCNDVETHWHTLLHLIPSEHRPDTTPLPLLLNRCNNSSPRSTLFQMDTSSKITNLVTKRSSSQNGSRNMTVILIYFTSLHFLLIPVQYSTFEIWWQGIFTV